MARENPMDSVEKTSHKFRFSAAELKVLRSDECFGIRVYRARTEDGNATAILTFLDEEGEEIKQSKTSVRTVTSPCDEPPPCKWR